MALSREQKIKVVEKLRESIVKQKAMVFVNFSKLKVQDTEILREKLSNIEAKFIVAKKTLAELAFTEEKIDFPKEDINNELGIVFGFEDEIAPAKAIYDFSKKQENLQIIGGYMKGKDKYEFLPAQEVIVLAQLPSKNELFASLLNTLFAPIDNFVYVQKANIKGLICVLEAIKNNQ